MKKKKILNLAFGIILFFIIAGLPTIFGIIRPSKAFAVCNQSWCGYEEAIPAVDGIPPCGCDNCELDCGPLADGDNGDLCSGCDQGFLTETATYQVTPTPTFTSAVSPSPTVTPQYLFFTGSNSGFATCVNTVLPPGFTFLELLEAEINGVLGVTWTGSATLVKWVNPPAVITEFTFENPQIDIDSSNLTIQVAAGQEIVQDSLGQTVGTQILATIEPALKDNEYVIGSSNNEWFPPFSAESVNYTGLFLEFDTLETTGELGDPVPWFVIPRSGSNQIPIF